jgi:mono/diheme cytochrome c family protein
MSQYFWPNFRNVEMSGFTNSVVLAGLTLVSLVATGTERPKVTAKEIGEGRAIYVQQCSSCHGNRGQGDGPAALTLDPAPPDFTTGNFKYGGKPEEIYNTLENGVPNSMMVSYKHLSENQRWALVAYVESLNKNKNGKQ